MLDGLFIFLFSFCLMMVLSFDALKEGFLSSLQEGQMGPRPLFPSPTKSWERKPSRSHQTLTPTKFVGVTFKAKVL